MGFIELVDFNENMLKPKGDKKARTRRSSKKKSEEESQAAELKKEKAESKAVETKVEKAEPKAPEQEPAEQLSEKAAAPEQDKQATEPKQE
jgi:large subunit ribosomal protein L17